MDSCNFMQIDTKGTFYNWARHGIHCFVENKLDRVLCNDETASYWDNMDCIALARHQSNHNPLLLRLEKQFLVAQDLYAFNPCGHRIKGLRRFLKKVGPLVLMAI